ncbi:hypothetical protein K6U59_02995 [Vibrio vulnificus]|uniref:hypothetical protein n=1 Tax=Vibrio vulnificus TaxID=672 RepID=UPI001EEC6B7B|nr:hypothetical protein [Vibrio vulnificus]MCG6275848.1 hypothetical protein [Vibrio vulnificus]
MPSNVVINWSQPVDIDGAHYPKDTLNRAKYAQYLSNFLASKGYDESREGELALKFEREVLLTQPELRMGQR